MFKKYSVVLLILVVLISSLFWRFVNFGERWTLSQDQARDGIIGLYSVSHGVLPLVGPPSSAGEFSFGPFYYWLIILFTLIIPAVNGPWIGFALLSASTALAFFYLGYLSGGRSAGFIYGMLSAFSSGFIFHSPDMLNPVPVAFLTSLAFLFIYILIEKKKIFFAFWTGFTLGIAVNFHYQALGLLILIPIIAVFSSLNLHRKFYILLLGIFGLFTSFLPLIYFNFTHHNILFTNFIKFLSSGPNGAGNGNSFFNDTFVFWPQFWGETLINIPLSGYFFLLFFFTALFLKFGNESTHDLTVRVSSLDRTSSDSGKPTTLQSGFYRDKKNFDRSFYIISVAAIFQIIFLFIYRGVRLPVYLIVFQPYLVYLTGWSIWILFKTNKYIGAGILTVIILASIPGNWQIVNDNKSQVADIFSLKSLIDGKINGTVKIYNDEKSNMVSLPLYYLYLKENRISGQGQEIIACENRVIEGENAADSKWSCPENTQVLAELKNFKIYMKNETGLFQEEEITQENIYQRLYSKYE